MNENATPGDLTQIEAREQSVSLVELFYDLIYVYAISKMTSIFHGDELSGIVFLHYFVASFVVIQAWMYMTNYVNRFGRKHWYENLAIILNMGATIFMSNTISAEWGAMLASFNASMFVMLGIVAVLYLNRLRGEASSRATALFSLKTLGPVCIIYLAIALFSDAIPPNVALGLDVAAVAWGIFGPAIVNRASKVDISRISLPHLAERFELITIITFGESVVTVAEVCEEYGLGVASVGTFLGVILLFGCYVVLMHNIVEHHQVQRGLRLIYCHFFIIVAVNLVTVAVNHMGAETEQPLAFCSLGSLGIAMFFTSLFLLYPYHRDDVHFSLWEWVALVAFAAIGSACCFLGLALRFEGFLIGPVVSGGGCFAILLAKDKAFALARRRDHRA